MTTVGELLEYLKEEIEKEKISLSTPIQFATAGEQYDSVLSVYVAHEDNILWVDIE